MFQLCDVFNSLINQSPFSLGVTLSLQTQWLFYRCLEIPKKKSQKCFLTWATLSEHLSALNQAMRGLFRIIFSW